MQTIQLLTPELESLTEALQVFQWPEESESRSDSVRQAESERNAFSWDALTVSSDDRCIPRPVSFQWDDIRGQSENLVYDLFLSTNTAFENPSVYRDLSEPYRSVVNLHIGTRYFWQVIARDRAAVLAKSPVWTFVTHSNPPRWLHVPGITNVRDIGGWGLPGNRRVRQGLVYRSSEMHGHIDITDDGRRVLCEDLKIRTDIDLRGSAENPKAVLDESVVNWINIPIRPYKNIVTDENRDQYRKVFQVFADPSAYPILFHCWGGCDRGGTIAFLLQALLGMDIDSLIRDYELSSLSIWGERSHLSGQFQSFLSVLLPFGDARSDIGKQVENYLLSIGVTAHEIAVIRNQLTERVPDQDNSPDEGGSL